MPFFVIILAHGFESLFAFVGEDEGLGREAMFDGVQSAFLARFLGFLSSCQETIAATGFYSCLGLHFVTPDWRIQGCGHG